MKVFFVGDFITNTGPAMVNKLLIKGLKDKNILYTQSVNRVKKFVEMLYKIIKSDCVCFCSYSKYNYFGLSFAKILNKKCFYLMHGYRTLEEKINNPDIADEKIKLINSREKKIFSKVDKIFCVSEDFMQFMRKSEPDFKMKFDYNFNPIDISSIQKTTSRYITANNKNQLVSIGGGMKRKNNLAICKAIDKLNKNENMDLKYIVIGLPYTDKQSICKYEFVEYHDKLTHDEVLKILGESYLYLQNSSFETFGLGVIEALISDCNLLISKNIGAKGVLKTIEESDIIYDFNNINEIADKIKNVLKNPNAKRLTDGFEVEKVDFLSSSKSLYDKMYNYYKKTGV